jgi:hypothetical protein
VASAPSSWKDGSKARAIDVGPDDATPLGATPRELARDASPRSFTIAWADPANPVATDWTLTLDDSVAAGSVSEWRDAPGCPADPSAVIDVDGTLTSPDLALGAWVRMEWDEPMGLHGEPTFSAESYPFDDELTGWVWSVVRSEQPGAEGTLEAVFLGGRLDDGRALGRGDDRRGAGGVRRARIPGDPGAGRVTLATQPGASPDTPTVVSPFPALNGVVGPS